MVSSYTTNKQIEKPANGDYNNTWSTPVNSDWDIIDRAFGGTTTLNAVAASGTVTLTTNQYQAPIVAITGALTANVNYQLPAGVGGFWFVFNNTSGSFSILFSSAGGGSTVTLAQGRTTAVICDGTNVGLADTSVPSAAGSTTQVQYNLSGQLAGSSNFVFDGSGNVGIGTNSPTYKLDVVGSASFGAAIITGTGLSTGDAQLELGANRTGSGLAYIDLHAVTGTDFEARLVRYGGVNGGLDLIQSGTGGIVIANEGSADTVFKTNATERMRITNSGFVGVGTSTDNGIDKLTVAGIVGAVTSGRCGLHVYNGGGTAEWFIGQPSAVSPNLTFSKLVAGTYTDYFVINTVGGITSADAADAVGYKGIPQNAKTASYTLALSDMGEHISITTGGVIIPANGSVAFPIGSAVSIYNDSGSNQTISITTDTLRLAGTASTGSRTLAQYGVATVLKVASTVWVISGAGVS